MQPLEPLKNCTRMGCAFEWYLNTEEAVEELTHLGEKHMAAFLSCRGAARIEVEAQGSISGPASVLLSTTVQSI